MQSKHSKTCNLFSFSHTGSEAVKAYITLINISTLITYQLFFQYIQNRQFVYMIHGHEPHIWFTVLLIVQQ